jgi:hypothetical protein
MVRDIVKVTQLANNRDTSEEEIEVIVKFFDGMKEKLVEHLKEFVEGNDELHFNDFEIFSKFIDYDPSSAPKKTVKTISRVPRAQLISWNLVIFKETLQHSFNYEKEIEKFSKASTEGLRETVSIFIEAKRKTVKDLDQVAAKLGLDKNEYHPVNFFTVFIHELDRTTLERTAKVVFNHFNRDAEFLKRMKDTSDEIIIKSVLNLVPLDFTFGKLDSLCKIYDLCDNKSSFLSETRAMLAFDRKTLASRFIKKLVLL